MSLQSKQMSDNKIYNIQLHYEKTHCRVLKAASERIGNCPVIVNNLFYLQRPNVLFKAFLLTLMVVGEIQTLSSYS